VSTLTTTPSVIPRSTELGRIGTLRQRYALYAVLVLVLVFFVIVRVRLRNVPLERDEGEYAYSGQLILQGIPPYNLAYNMKLPGTYVAYAVIMGALGETPAAVRLGLLVVNGATSLFVFLIGKRLHGQLTGVIAGCTYALLSTRSSVLGFSGHATHFVIFFALAGILLLLRAIDIDSDNRKNSLFLISGLLLGLGFLMKQHGILLAAFAGLYLLWELRADPFRDLSFRATIFAAGIALPYLLTCLILYRAGVFHEFWFWTVSYGRAYASEMTLRDGLEMIRAVGPWMVRPFVIWEIAAVGLTALIWSSKVSGQAAFSVGFLIFSILGVIPGYYFRPHYFILLLPAVALWVGIAIAAAQEWLAESHTRQRLAWIPLAIFAAAFAFSVHGQHNYFFRRDPVKFVVDSNGCGDDCEGDLEVGNYLKANASPQDQVAVLGSEPAIYFYSHRHSATGYLYMYALTENQKFKQHMQQEMISEVENTKPKFVVYVDDGYSWWNLGSTKEIAYLQPLQEWVQHNYQMEKLVPLKMNAEHQWGDHSAFYIFRRIAP
jgi:hypothetical protein